MMQFASKAARPIGPGRHPRGNRASFSMAWHEPKDGDGWGHLGGGVCADTAFGGRVSCSCDHFERREWGNLQSAERRSGAVCPGRRHRGGTGFFFLKKNPPSESLGMGPLLRKEDSSCLTERPNGRFRRARRGQDVSRVADRRTSVSLAAGPADGRRAHADATYWEGVRGFPGMRAEKFQ